MVVEVACPLVAGSRDVVFCCNCSESDELSVSD